MAADGSRTLMIVLAGGSGSRVRDDVNKVYLPLGEQAVLAFSLLTMEACQSVSDVVLVIREMDRHQASVLVDDLAATKVTTIVAGGDSRHQSEFSALTMVAPAIEAGDYGVVAIHDAARPFATARLVEDVIGTAGQVGGAIPALAVEAPIYRVENGSVSALPSDTVRRVQTPQAFWARPLLEAYRRAEQAGFEGVDTAETVERFSDLEVAVVSGDPRNLKLTFVEDIFRAEDLAAIWDSGDWRP